MANLEIPVAAQHTVRFQAMPLFPAPATALTLVETAKLNSVNILDQKITRLDELARQAGSSGRFH